MPRFEYLVRTFRVSVNAIDSTFTEELNKLGDEGWEAIAMSTPVSTVQRGGSAMQDRAFVFKRPKTGLPNTPVVEDVEGDPEDAS